MKHLSGLSIALATLWAFSGCTTVEPGVKAGATASVTASQLSEGYALLYELLSKEKQASMLSIVKNESPELKSLLERISETSKTAVKELDTLATLNPPLDLKVQRLPKIEQAARDSIDKQTRKELLHSQGVDLEFNMVSSQLSGMNYAAHLARTLAVAETNQVRKDFLHRTDRKFTELHGQVYKMMFARYQN